MDQLSDFLERFPLRAGVFYTGALCGTYDFPRDIKPGHFHLVRSGRLELTSSDHDQRRIERPSVIFMPAAGTHRLVADPGVEILCATVRFGGAGISPVARALPPLVVLPLADAHPLTSLCDAMFEEAGSERPGRRTTLNRLCELGVIAALRLCIDREWVSGGLLAGLADPRLSKAMVAMCEQPGREWCLVELAALATMSRARFAAQFRAVVGETPGDHLAARRVQEAQQLLRNGLPLKQVADRVGYGSASALTRAFTRVVGMAPSHWRVGSTPVP